MEFTKNETEAVLGAVQKEIDFCELTKDEERGETLRRARARLLGHAIVAVSSMDEIRAAPMFSYLVWAGELAPYAGNLSERPWGFFDGDAWDDDVEVEIERLHLDVVSSSVQRDDNLNLPASYTDDDAMLDALRNGARLVKLPDSMVQFEGGRRILSKHWRLYATSEEDS